MKTYVWKCEVCKNKDDNDKSHEGSSTPCFLMTEDKDLFDSSTKCPVDGEDDACFILIGTSRGVNKI